jgi:hypothetical protein
MPYGYRGLKIFTSLSLRFQDFQRLTIGDVFPTVYESAIELNDQELTQKYLNQ